MQNKGFAVRRPPKHTAKCVYVVCLSGKLTTKNGTTDIFQILNICAAIFTGRGNICHHGGKLQIQQFTMRERTAHGKWRPSGRAVRPASNVGPDQQFAVGYALPCAFSLFRRVPYFAVSFCLSLPWAELSSCVAVRYAVGWTCWLMVEVLMLCVDPRQWVGTWKSQIFR
jgi:hypothetical protein